MARTFKADSIIALMVETKYALQKFIEACLYVYSKQLENVELYINIETLTAYNNLDSILQSPYFKYVSGIVLGQDDMAKSMNLDFEEINSDKMLKIVLNVAKKVSNYNKKFILGGNIRPQAIQFLLQIPKGLLSGYETRMMTFDYSNDTNEQQINKNIKLALNFEIEWLELKEKKQKKFYNII